MILKQIFSISKLWYFIIWILFIVWWYYYFSLQDFKKPLEKTLEKNEIVWTWSLKETIDVVWTSELVDEQSLKFTKAWTITKVNFKEWDKIEKWDIIAEIDNSDWLNSVTEAEINLENAKIALDELYEPADQSKILQSQNSIQNSKNSIAIAKKELETLVTTQANTIEDTKNDIINLKKDLETSKNSLELSKNDLELSKKNLELTQKQQTNSLSNTTSNKLNTITQVENNFASDLTSISKIIEQVDYILWVTDANKTKNDSYEVYLWAKNVTYKSQAETALYSSIWAFELLSKSVKEYEKNWNIDKIKELLWEFKNIYSILETTTDFTYKTLENSVVSDTLSESELESKKSTIYSYLTTVQSKLNSVNSSINTLNTLTDTELVEISNNNTIESLKNSIAQKEESIKTSEVSIEKKQQEIDSQIKNLETTIKNQEIALQNKKDSISQLEKTLKVNQESYNELMEWPTSQNVKKAQNSITQAELKLKSAQEALDDYKLEAPFDWIIRKIDYMVWDNLTTDTDKYVYIENPDLLEITVMLDQVDIWKVEVWTLAYVTFDAYPTLNVKAKISQIDTAPVQSSWVTSYTVTIILDDESFDKKVLSWMTADVEIVVSQVENAILVSTTAITTQDDKSYVTVNKNWKMQQVEITTGMSSDWKTQVLTWLSVWDNIVIKTYSATKATTEITTQSTSLFPTWWWGWNRSAWWPPGWF